MEFIKFHKQDFFFSGGDSWGKSKAMAYVTESSLFLCEFWEKNIKIMIFSVFYHLDFYPFLAIQRFL